MTTSLNDTVAEVYRELIMQQRENTILKQLQRHPMGIYTRLRSYVRRFLCEYGRKTLFRRKSNNIPSFNVFKPTDKVFPDTKIAVYSVITGGYDSLKGHIYVDDELDYYLVTDIPASKISAMAKIGTMDRINIIPVPEHLEGLSSARSRDTSSCILMKFYLKI